MKQWMSRAISGAVALMLSSSVAGVVAHSARAEVTPAVDSLAQAVLALTQTASQSGLSLVHTTTFKEAGKEIMQTKVGETGLDGWAMHSSSRVVEGGTVTESEVHWGTDWSSCGDWVSFSTLVNPARASPGSLDSKAISRVGRVGYVTDMPTELSGGYDWYPFQVAEPLLFLAQSASVDTAGEVMLVESSDRISYVFPMRGVRDTDVVSLEVVVDKETGFVVSTDYSANYGDLGAYSSRITVKGVGSDVQLTIGIPEGARTATFESYSRAAGTVLLAKAAKMTAQYLNKVFLGKVTKRNLADRGTRVAGDYLSTAGNLLSRSTSVFCPESAGSAAQATYRGGRLVLETSCGWDFLGRVKAVVAVVGGKAALVRQPR